ncbi:MAG: hypothetical protein ACYTG5_00870 [Planctomycetota bacterium]|jgi:hypothetical protein
MHQGQFPEGYRPGGEVEYQRGEAAAGELRQLRQRRLFMVAAFGVVGAGASFLLYRTGQKSGPAGSDSDPRRGTLDWALGMLQEPDADLLQAAGDLERVSMLHRQEKALSQVFERLLDVALVSGEQHADWAGACAIRSLGRLGSPELATYRSQEIGSSSRHPLMAEALETLGRRRGGGR